MRMPVAVALTMILAAPPPGLSGAPDEAPPTAAGGEAGGYLALSRAELAMERGDYGTALDTLLRDGDAGSVFTAYYAARCLSALGRGAEARGYYERVLSFEGVPAWMAADCRGEIEAPRGEGDARRFRLFYRAGYEYDSNVTLQPDDSSIVVPSGKGDWRFTNEVGIGVTPLERGRFRLDADYHFFNTVHNHLGDFNMLGNELAGTATWRGDAIQPFAGYGFDYYFLDDCAQDYLRRNVLFAGANVPEGDFAMTQFVYALSFEDYFLRYYDPADNRDDHNNRAGFNQYFFPRLVRDSWLRLGSFYDRNSAVGDNYFYDGWCFQAEYYLPLTEAMWLDLNAEYYYRDYPRNVEGRRDHEQEYVALLSRRLTPHFIVSAQYYLNVTRSTEALFQYKRNVFSLFGTIVY